MKSLLELQKAYKAATTRTEQDQLLAAMQDHPDRSLELIYDGNYVTVYCKPLGSLLLRPTTELLAEFRNPVENGDYGLVFKNESNLNNPMMLWDLLEDWLCNSEYDLTNSNCTGDLIDSSCPIIIKDGSTNEMGDIIDYSDKWYFSQYQVRNEYYDLYNGALHLDKA